MNFAPEIRRIVELHNLHFQSPEILLISFENILNKVVKEFKIRKRNFNKTRDIRIDVFYNRNKVLVISR